MVSCINNANHDQDILQSKMDEFSSQKVEEVFEILQKRLHKATMRWGEVSGFRF